jgi:hypothetical protein
MRCYLFNIRENLIDAFDAIDASDARRILLARCRADNTGYILAVAVRRGIVSSPIMAPDVTDEAL